jgi:hypothetical protein
VFSAEHVIVDDVSIEPQETALLSQIVCDNGVDIPAREMGLFLKEIISRSNYAKCLVKDILGGVLNAGG